MATSPANTHVISYWEGPVSWLERLCLRSVLDAGNTITIYSYDPENLQRAGFHDDIRDARDIIPENNIYFRYIQNKRYTLFTNLFRLVAQIQGLGTWVDLDCYFVKHFSVTNEYYFGWVSDRKLNGAVLHLPSGSDMARDYLDGISKVPLRTPWSTWRRRMLREIEILAGQELPKPKTRSNIGPRALTYYATRHGKIQLAQSKDVLYPIPSRLAPCLTHSDDKQANGMITENTKIVHAWQGKLKRTGQLSEIPIRTSFLGAAYLKHGL